MSWKCVCKEENNPDESKICKNCGRKRPKYFGVKLDLAPSKKMNNEQKSVWYLMIAHDHLLESDEYLNLDKEFSVKLGDQNYDSIAVESKMSEYKKKAENNCNKCLDILEKSSALSPEAQFEDAKGYVQSIASIKSNCYFNLGSIYFRSGNLSGIKKTIEMKFEKAIEYYQSSYDSDPNQVSIYNIAMATINLPAEKFGLFGGDKEEAAKETKREQEIDLLKKTIKFAPFSDLGIKSARMLMEDYSLSDIDV